MVGVRNGDKCSQMQYRIATSHGFFHPMRIADIACEHLELASHLGCAMLQPAPRVERVVEYKRAHSVALADQGLGQVRANEAISAGD